MIKYDIVILNKEGGIKMIQIKHVSGDNVDKWLTFIKGWIEYSSYIKVGDDLYDITMNDSVPVRLHFSDNKLLLDIGNRLYWLEQFDYSEIILQ